MAPQCNKDVAFNSVMTSHVIFYSVGTVFTVHPPQILQIPPHKRPVYEELHEEDALNSMKECRQPPP